MTVKELLFVTSGSVRYRIEPYDKWNKVLIKGVIVDDIDFNNIPYGDCEVQHISIDNGELVVLI